MYMSLKRNLIFCNSLYQNIVIFGSLSFKLKLYRILDLCDISVQLLGCILQASYLGMIHQCVILCKIICSVGALRSHFYYCYDFIMLELFQLIFFTVQILRLYFQIWLLFFPLLFCRKKTHIVSYS